ncbi:MAG: nickel-responsive transcriptional regulator NikR [Deltaproteobacteria bacterium HGW-Deltaproteobacteria-19]|jgi:CopG family nickel-responsive transcriptional regulator|nr:MAG: nickel-responsive transcriptional regulator NikR [Deltaproteobacteria bacterium HGW-Deltaproteobacteria-19]
MSELVRFGVSLEKSLLDKFDRLIRERRYTNRSEALRDLIRQELVKKTWSEDLEVAGAITFIFDHHQRDLLNRITDIQHDYQKLIISTQHVHLDHDNCLEIVAVRGKAGRIQDLTDSLKAIRGVRHCSLSMSSAGKDVR